MLNVSKTLGSDNSGQDMNPNCLQIAKAISSRRNSPLARKELTYGSSMRLIIPPIIMIQ